MRNLDYLQFLMRLMVELLNILERKSEQIKINHTQTAVAVGLLVGWLLSATIAAAAASTFARCVGITRRRGRTFFFVV